MPSIRLEYYKGKPLAGGRFPIAVTVTHKGVPKRKYIDSCIPEEWDKTNMPHPIVSNNRKLRAQLSQRNFKLQTELHKYTEIFNNKIKSGEDWNSEDIFKEEAEKDKPDKKKEQTFWDLTEQYLQYLKDEKSGATYISFNGVIQKFKKHIDNPAFMITDFTDAIVDKYRLHMIDLGNSSSTQNSNFKVLRFVSNYAAKKKLASKPDALHLFKLPKRVYGSKRKLDDNEINLFRNVDVKDDSKISEIKDMFLLAYLFRGMRISDVIRMKQSFIRDGKLVYTSSKNEKLFDMRIPTEANSILKKYMDGRDYVFSFYTFKPNPKISAGQNRINEYNTIKSITANINNKLKVLGERAKIGKSISTHISRHSFAKKALETFKGDTNLTMDLLGHNSLAVHQAYVRELSKSDDLDDAVDQIFG